MKEKKHSGLKITAIIMVVILLAYTVLALLPRPINYKMENGMRKDGELPILIAHGGGNREFPDNTLEAFYNAYNADPRVMMETDVSITRDGVVILSHDTSIDRKSNGTGKIAELNYTDLIEGEVDFGYLNEMKDGVRVGEPKHFVGEDGEEKYPTDVPYPDGISPRHETVFLATTLEELLVAFPENRINVEIKQDGAVGKRCLYAVLDLLEKYDAYDRVVLASFHDTVYSEFVRMNAAGEVPEGFMFSPSTGGVVKFFLLASTGLDVFYTDPITVFQIPMEEYGINLATAELVNTAHRHNLAVHYWTIDDEDDMRWLIDIGADGIMTNYPHRLKSVLEAEK